MIIVKMMGGLGNQLFQYAVGRALALRTHQRLAFDLEYYEITPGADTKRRLELNQLGLEVPRATQRDLRRLKEGHLFSLPILNKICDKFWRNSTAIVREDGEESIESILSLKGEAYLVGYWQSERYFGDFSESIRSDIQLESDLDSSALALQNFILEKNSVSLHVRRGDYVKDLTTNAYHGTCTIDYYGSAMKLVESHCPMPEYFVFSDDINWCRENLRSDVPLHFIDNNMGQKSYRDLCLMRQCKHHIIANSSFSWWGAWLDTNPQKLVIAPKKWFQVRDDLNDYRTPKGWTRL